MTLAELGSSFPQAAQPECREVNEKSYEQILNEIVDSLATEITANGFSKRLLELRETHSQQLIAYWQKRALLYKDAINQGKIQWGDEFSVGEELLQIAALDDDEDKGLEVLTTVRKMPRGEDLIHVIRDRTTGIEPYPSEIITVIKIPPEETYYTRFEITFCNCLLNTISRKNHHTDPSNWRAYVIEERTFDFSILV